MSGPLPTSILCTLQYKPQYTPQYMEGGEGMMIWHDAYWAYLVEIGILMNYM